MPEELALNPATSILLVMDYQRRILDRIERSAVLLSRVQSAVAEFREHGGNVGWVRVAFEEEDFDAVPVTSSFARYAEPTARAALHAESPSTQLDPQLDVRPSDIAVRKVRPGAFTSTDLDTQLRVKGIDTLVLAGISTSGVVLSTEREAIERDYRIVILEDACADPDAEIHDVLTRKVFPKHGSVTSVSELSRLWQ